MLRGYRYYKHQHTTNIYAILPRNHSHILKHTTNQYWHIARTPQSHYLHTTVTLPAHHQHTQYQEIYHTIFSTPPTQYLAHCQDTTVTLPAHYTHTACTPPIYLINTGRLPRNHSPHSQHSPPPPNSIPGTLSGYHSYSTLNTPTQYCHSKIPLSGNVFTNWSIKKKLFNSTHLNYITLQHKQVRLTIGNKSKEGFLDL